MKKIFCAIALLTLTNTSFVFAQDAKPEDKKEEKKVDCEKEKKDAADKFKKQLSKAAIMEAIVNVASANGKTALDKLDDASKQILKDFNDKKIDYQTTREKLNQLGLGDKIKSNQSYASPVRLVDASDSARVHYLQLAAAVGPLSPSASKDAFKKETVAVQSCVSYSMMDMIIVADAYAPGGTREIIDPVASQYSYVSTMSCMPIDLADPRTNDEKLADARKKMMGDLSTDETAFVLANTSDECKAKPEAKKEEKKAEEKKEEPKKDEPKPAPAPAAPTEKKEEPKPTPPPAPPAEAPKDAPKPADPAPTTPAGNPIQ